MCCVMPPASPATTFGLTDGVEQRRLAVVDVAHDGDDGRARVQALLRIAIADEADLDVGLRHALGRMPELGAR